MRDRPAISGIVLAGGRSRRMGGGDKCLLPLDGRALLAHVIDRFAPQVTALALSANRDPDRFAPFGVPVLEDLVEGFPGPLAGIHAAMRWAARSGTRLVATVPADAPFLPHDLVARLCDGLGERKVAIASSNDRLHPVVGLWDVSLADDLERWLRTGGSRKVGAWAKSRDCGVVDFAGGEPDPFFNVNAPDDLLAASRRRAAG